VRKGEGRRKRRKGGGRRKEEGKEGRRKGGGREEEGSRKGGRRGREEVIPMVLGLGLEAAL
jgi:hypothetical protein